MRALLDENDLSGKTVVLFGMHLGSRLGRDLKQIREQFPEAKILDGFTVYASAPNDQVRSQFGAWLDSDLAG